MQKGRVGRLTGRRADWQRGRVDKQGGQGCRAARLLVKECGQFGERADWEGGKEERLAGREGGKTASFLDLNIMTL